VKSILRRRPSPALVISCIALFVSLGGVSYGVATGFIDSREIKNNEIRSTDLRNNQIRTFDIRNNEVRGFDIRNSSVQGRDVALNTLTGADIAEGELGKVPSATVADTATSADSAGGVTFKSFNYRGQEGSGLVNLFALGGLSVQARCDAGPVLVVSAQTTADNSELISDFAGSPAGGFLDFDIGDTGFLADDGLAPPAQQGRAAYAGSDGRAVVIEGIAVQELDGVGGTTSDCGFSGVAQTG
jgi:hypothetical protein